VFRVQVRPVRHDIPLQVSRLEKAAASRAGNDAICELLRSLPIDYKSNRAQAVSVPLIPVNDLSHAISGDD
jgi:hypothetical protein